MEFVAPAPALPLAPHAARPPAAAASTHARQPRARGWWLAAALAGTAVAAQAGTDALPAGLEQRVRELALDASRRGAPGIARIEVSVGRLNPRLRLAPCERIEPYLPAGTALWGKARIGLRCTRGVTPWNVYLPIIVSAFGPAWVAAAPLAAGTEVAARDLVQAEIDLAEGRSRVIADPAEAVGRTLARSLNAGQALRETDLKARQWFSAGEQVKVVARGRGFAVAGVGQALGHGLEGQSVRVRTESGRVVTAMPVGERQVELPL